MTTLTATLKKISPIEKYLSGIDNQTVIDRWINHESGVMQLMAKDIVSVVGTDSFVKSAIQQDKITNAELGDFILAGFLLESERVNWYERNHSSIVGYSKLFMESQNQTIESWAEWSKWNLPTTTATDRTSHVHKLTLTEISEIFLSGNVTHDYHEPIAAAFAMTMLSIMTDRFLDMVEYLMAATNNLMDTVATAKIQ